MAANPVAEWVSWEFTDIHVAVLGPEAASYTANFRNVSRAAGEDVTTTGSWTYVLRRTSEGWRVVHSNGKHNEFSYYDSAGP
jgi:ketosteroid isomerase-like protein